MCEGTDGMIVRQEDGIKNLLNHLTCLAADKAREGERNSEKARKAVFLSFFNICENLNNRLSNILGSI